MTCEKRIMLLYTLFLFLSVCFAKTDEVWNCNNILNIWKPGLALYPLDGSRAEVLYKKPSKIDDYFGIEKLIFSLMRNEANFSCRFERRRHSYYTYESKVISKEDFCSESFCELEFSNLTLGYYCVQMLMQLRGENIEPCLPPMFLDYTIRIKPIISDPVRVTSDTSESREKFVSGSAITWIVVGSLVVVGLVLAFALDTTWSRRMRQQYSIVNIGNNEVHIDMKTFSTNAGPSTDLLLARELTGRLLVLYCYDNQDHFFLVKYLVDLLRHTLPKWDIVFDYEHTNDICTKGTVRWVTDTLRRVDRIVIIGSERALQQTQIKPNQHAHDNKGDINYVFVFAWNCILNDPNLRGNYGKVFNTRLRCTDPKYVLPNVVPGRHFVLPNNYVELINHILGSSTIADTFCRDLKAKLEDCPPYEALTTAIDRMAGASIESLNRSVSSQEYCWIKPGN